MSDDGDRSSAPPRALRRLVDELRAEEAPPPDWEQLEAQLSVLLDRDTADAASASSSVERASTRARATAEGATEDARTGAAEILVPWDDDPLEDEAWRSLRRPTLDDEPARAAPREVRAEPRSVAGAGRLPASPARGRRPSLLVAGAFVAAVTSAAAGAWFAARPGGVHVVVAEPVDLASVALEPRLEGTLDLASLRAGDVVEAVEGPVRFGRDGVLAWTLSAGGRVRVVSGIGHEELRHVVALEAGALHVEVVPLDERGVVAERGAAAPSTQERFVVEVGDARVAVHGTEFHVVRSSQGIVVDVARGVVAVRRAVDAPGSGQRLEAPHRAAFAVDGTGYRELPARRASARAEVGAVGRDDAPVAARSTDHASQSPDEQYAGLSQQLDVTRGHGSGSAPAHRPAPATQDTPIAAVPPTAGAWTSERVRGEVISCIVRSAAARSSNVRVTVESRLVVDVAPDGLTRGLRFDPPLRPDFQACAQPVFGARFAPGTGRLLVPVEVVLEPSAGGPTPPPR